MKAFNVNLNNNNCTIVDESNNHVFITLVDNVFYDSEIADNNTVFNFVNESIISALNIALAAQKTWCSSEGKDFTIYTYDDIEDVTLTFISHKLDAKQTLTFFYIADIDNNDVEISVRTELTCYDLVDHDNNVNGRTYYNDAPLVAVGGSDNFDNGVISDNMYCNIMRLVLKDYHIRKLPFLV